MHPGWATTEGVRKSIPGFYKFYQVRSAWAMGCKSPEVLRPPLLLGEARCKPEAACSDLLAWLQEDVVSMKSLGAPDASSFYPFSPLGAYPLCILLMGSGKFMRLAYLQLGWSLIKQTSKYACSASG